MIVLGEVRTGLLQHSHALPDSDVARLLDLVAGERVRQSTRPLGYAVSPELLTGLDCAMSTETGRAVRVAGTAVCRATMLGGHVIQGSTFTTLSDAWDRQRQPWAHYLSQPGVLKPIGKARPASLAAAFLDVTASGGLLDLGAVSGRTIDTVQRNRLLDRRPPFRTTRTGLRWVATVSDDSLPHTGPRTGPDTDVSVALTLVDPRHRNLSLTCHVTDVRHVVRLCEDLAVHDWLLTTVVGLVERAQIGGRPRPEVIDRLRPVIDHLAHLWMPTARLHREVAPLWRRLEERPGFSRQWQNLITRIRDQLTLALLSAPQHHGQVRAGL